MEEKKSKVILHGMWASTYSKRVEIALKLKGISYEYVEEDLKNKIDSLIQLNPVHKKIPLLVHDGKPVAESQVFEVMARVLSQESEAQAKSVVEARERFRVLEEGLKKHSPNKIIRGNDDVGLLDIIIIASSGVHKVFHEAIGVEIIGPVNTPTLYNWIERLQELPMIKEVEVPHDRLVTFLQKYRQVHLQQAAKV
ncbi:hypothetical protein N665_0076s0388 [Sinapis alba]|nr:hypothetical protein N665_0076s0388 [Sinapis alba]